MKLVAALRLRTRSKRRATFSRHLSQIREVLRLDPSLRLKIMDLGGTVLFWEDWWQVTDGDRLDITLINNHLMDISARGRRPKCSFISDLNQDATSLRVADIQRFDLVFSNGFLEHLPGRGAQASLTAAIVASAVPYFIEVPNKYSPVDSHFPYGPPFFAAYPRSMRIRLCTWSSFGSGWRAPSLAAPRASRTVLPPAQSARYARVLPDRNAHRRKAIPHSHVQSGRLVQADDRPVRRRCLTHRPRLQPRNRLQLNDRAAAGCLTVRWPPLTERCR